MRWRLPHPCAPASARSFAHDIELVVARGNLDKPLAPGPLVVVVTIWAYDSMILVEARRGEHLGRR